MIPTTTVKQKTKIHDNPGAKTSHKSHGYMCSNSQKYIVWVKIIAFFLYAKNH